MYKTRKGYYPATLVVVNRGEEVKLLPIRSCSLQEQGKAWRCFPGHVFDGRPVLEKMSKNIDIVIQFQTGSLCEQIDVVKDYLQRAKARTG